MSEPSLHVVLCWHMHQPEYRDPRSGRFAEPWTLLHGLKDYTDMAAHLERVDGAQVVVNFSPLVLEQIAVLVDELDAFLAGGPAPGEPLLAVLGDAGPPPDPDERARLLERCLRAHPERQVARHPPLERLSRLARAALDDPGVETWLDDAFVADLAGWYLLAWLGESVRRDDMRARRLLQCELGFDAARRQELLELVRDQLAGIIPRWRALAEAGRVELSCNPYAHPILPLLIDFGAAHEARPEVELPEGRYPDGGERARAHLHRARAVHAQYFGAGPAGCWPSEGGVSDAALALIGEAGFAWAASGQQVLRHSLDEEDPGSDLLHRPWRVGEAGPLVFFRDDGLSDRIGFTYQDWHADDAVADLLECLEAIADDPEAGPGRVVPIVLDGENAWEYYPDNAWHFLDALYQRLAEHPRIALTTFGALAAEPDSAAGRLDHVVAGSWVYGDFNTWIGDPQKNRAWTLLLETRAAVEAARAAGAPWTDEAERRLMICEASDWFWWPGEYNPADAVASFDRLFRHQLAALCDAVGAAPPADLDHSFARGEGHPEHGGTMRRG
ncbi:MAG: glycoside hydrolase family 57 protein [Halofilum sp. (in: g-proteobacteria)]|nr:glycoside hydrolase family 57 protein [Halofilum sp. (in: g-proteobacteria)]